MSNESFKNPLWLMQAIGEVGPKASKLRLMTDHGGKFWKEGLLIYEQEFALAKAYFGFIEKDQNVDRGYLTNLANILGWVRELEEESFRSRALRREDPGPLFVSPNDKDIIENQIHNLGRPNFEADAMNKLNLLFFLSGCVNELHVRGLTNPLALSR